MIVLLILAGYVAGVFLARWCNIQAYRMDETEWLMPGLWFIPVIGPLFMFSVYLNVYFTNHEVAWWEWFKGENLKNK